MMLLVAIGTLVLIVLLQESGAMHATVAMTAHHLLSFIAVADTGSTGVAWSLSSQQATHPDVRVAAKFSWLRASLRQTRIHFLCE